MAILNPNSTSPNWPPAPEFTKESLGPTHYQKIYGGGQAGIYRQEYFSGSQCGVYIGDIYVDEVTFMQYMVHQSKTPIYGYASQLLDAVAPGVVLVEGSMSVNFKEAGYLWLCLARYKAFEQTTELAVKKVLGSYVGNEQDLKGVRIGSPRWLAQYGSEKERSGTTLGGANIPFLSKAQAKDTINQETIEVIGRVTRGEASQGERFALYRAISGLVAPENGSEQSTAFEILMSEFESKVWLSAPKGAKLDLDYAARRTDDNSFDDFDIFVTYGDWTNPAASKTVRRIRGVRLTSMGQEVHTTGEPIQENYQFLARNIL